MAPLLRYFVVILITRMMISCSCNQKMKFSQSEMIGRNLYVSDEQSSAVVEAKSHLQCLTSCHLAENCQSFVYGEFNCYHYSKIVDGKDLIEKDGYNYFRIKTKEPKTKFPESAPVTSTSTASASSTTTTSPSTISSTARTTKGEMTNTLYKEKVTWDRAKEECESHNSRLVCIHDKETQDKVVNVIKDGKPDGDIWIGLEVVSKGGPFRWTDGTEVSGNKNAGYYHNYRDSDPNEYDKSDDVAVRMVFPKESILFPTSPEVGKWADIYKSKNYWYVCESK